VAFKVNLFFSRIAFPFRHSGGSRQTTFQLLVASCEEKAKMGEGDVCRTKKIATDAKRHVLKEASLQSGKTYWWSVRVWNEKDEM